MEILNATFQLSECYHFLYCQKYKTKCDLNFKYGNINEYLNQDYEKLEKKATKYINELKKMVIMSLNLKFLMIIIILYVIG